MIIWILAFLLFGLFAWLGLVSGAIRTAVLLIGLILGAFLAVPLGPLLRPLFPLMGVTNAVWLWLLPPVLAFFLIQIIVGVVAFVVHRQVELHYKYRTDDVHRLRWERFNRRLGACVGLLTGCGYLILIALIVYVAGYSTVQVASADTAPKSLQLLNQARQDLRSTGLEKLVGRFDSTPPTYYQASDVIGLTYNNPLLQSRLASYPPFLSLAERPEFQDIANDTEFNQMLQTQENITKIIEHPKVQAILKNQEILKELSQVDLKDLQQYLETGKSAKYEDEKILGRWELDLPTTLNRVKTVLTNVPASVFSAVKQALNMSKMTLIATPDNKVFVKIQAKDEIMKLATAPPPTLAPAAAPGTAAPAARRPGTGYSPSSLAARANPNSPQMDPRMLQRYGNLMNQQQQQQAPAPVVVAPPKPAAPSPILKLIISGEGTWKKEDDKYLITLQQDGKPKNMDGAIHDDALSLSEQGFTLAFDKE
jgi:uncharacterized membrane protein required for colicin V production